MRIAIHQPNFLPYLGFFDKCDYSDILVLYDSTQFKKNDFQNRNKIKTKDGWKWLTIPISYNFGDLINKVKIDNSQDWRNKHLVYLKENYYKSAFFDVYFDKIKEIYNKEWTYLSDFNISLIIFLIKELGIKCKIVKSSDLDINLKSTDALIEICKELNADEYVSGKDGRNYLDKSLFEKENIKVLFQDYKHPIYQQQFYGFEPFMSILDLLFNEGSNSLNVIRGGRKFEDS
ncbi:MAG: WbqC family protein [Nanoarchaeota archaeon]|nr:WbqC family protein [Nanoarchaeota archaeon]